MAAGADMEAKTVAAAGAGMEAVAVVAADTGVVTDEDKGAVAEWEWGGGEC